MSFKKLTSSYRKYLNTDGGSDRDEYINSFIDATSDSFDKSPSYEKVTKNDVLDVFYDTWIFDEFAYKKEIEEKKIVMKPLQSINRGEYINRSDGKWLVTDQDKQYSFNEKGRIRKCNYLLQWKNQEGTIINRWAVITNEIGQTIAVDETNYMRLGEGKYEISLQNDNESKRLSRDKRFIIGGLAYRTTSTNNVTRNGLQVIMIQEHQVNTTIDLINVDGTGIANYYGNSVYSIEFSMNTISLAVGGSITLSWIIKYGGVVVNDKQVNIESNENFVTISNVTNNSCTVNAVTEGSTTLSVNLVGNDSVSDSLDITIDAVPSENISEFISGSSTININESANYEIHRFVNSIDDGSQYAFNLNNSLATLINIGTNTATVVAGNNLGNLILTAINITTLEQFTFNIEIISLW
jgi:hypothetical protein